METFITIVHYIVSLFLVTVILLQAGKGADIGAAFGAGGSQTLFGPRGAATFLNKLTAGVAVVFLMTSLGLVTVSRHGGANGSVLGKVPLPPPAQTAPAAPSETPPAAAPDDSSDGSEGGATDEAPLTTPETEQ